MLRANFYCCLNVRCIHIVLMSFVLSTSGATDAIEFDNSCWRRAADRYNLDPVELAAHACVESGLRTDAVNKNLDGSEDFTVMQINSRNLPRLAKYGITRTALQQDACLSVQVGAYLLSQNKARLGDSWEATGAYNAGCGRLKGFACRQARAKYAWKVYRAMNNLRTNGHC